MATQEGENIKKRAPQVDIVFGPQTIHRIPSMINKASQKNNKFFPSTKFKFSFPFDNFLLISCLIKIITLPILIFCLNSSKSVILIFFLPINPKNQIFVLCL